MLVKNIKTQEVLDWLALHIKEPSDPTELTSFELMEAIVMSKVELALNCLENTERFVRRNQDHLTLEPPVVKGEKCWSKNWSNTEHPSEVSYKEERDWATLKQVMKGEADTF